MLRNVLYSFYSKISLALLASFLLIGLLLLGLAQHLSKIYQNEVEQKLHKNLAYHVVKDNELLVDGEIDHGALKHAFHNMMILGPDFEFYLLDAEGNIQTYSAEPGKVKRASVSLNPIHNFIEGIQSLPILGDDPRSLTNEKIFSVSPLYDGENIKGYLYIIIGGEIYDGISQILKNSHNLTLAAWSLIFALVFGLVATLLLFALLTRPLRKLTQDIQAFRQEGFQSGKLPVSKWDAQSSDEIQRLGNTFNEMAAALNDQYQKVKNTDELRRELIAYVSHDLRTPLASLQGYLETWQLKFGQQTSSSEQGGSVTQKTNEGEFLIEIALKNAHQMSRLIEQLFELAHLDADDMKLELEPLMIAELAQDVLMKFQLAAEKKNIQLELVAAEPTLLVNGNIEKLERVLTNLLDNAIRHCKKGDSIQVIVEANKESASGVSVKVRDTGIGIRREEQSRIFEGHFRASNSVSGTGTNSGLGLAISARVVELHGSKLKVISQLGEGSEFSFNLSEAA